MIVTPIENPLPGETILATDPVMGPAVESTWRRRARFFPGRAVSDLLLTGEQLSRATRSALLGRTRTPGVVSGLDVSVSVEGGQTLLSVSAGRGLTAAGEDVVIPLPLRVPLTALAGAAPGLHVLLVSPVIVPVVGQEDLTLDGVPLTESPCSRDPADAAYADESWADGALLSLWPWPSSVPLPPAGDPRRRNRIAHWIFELERISGGPGRMPWEQEGVALAVLEIDSMLNILIFDKYAALRQAGLSRPRAPLLPCAGWPSLWQARMDQLGEHLADLPWSEPGFRLHEHVRFLPPVGVLPSGLLRLWERGTTGLNATFLPANVGLEAAPVPMEQVDALLRAVAGLEPLDLDEGAPEALRVLVPVPHSSFDPDLLWLETPHPAFGEAVYRATASRTGALHRRQALRARAGALIEALRGPLPPRASLFPLKDRDALDPDEEATTGPQLWSLPNARRALDLLRRGEHLSSAEPDPEAHPLTDDAWRATVSRALADDAAIGDLLASALSPSAAETPLILLDREVAPPADSGTDDRILAFGGALLASGMLRSWMATDRARGEVVLVKPTLVVLHRQLTAPDVDAASGPTVFFANSVEDDALEHLERRWQDGAPLPLVVLAPGDARDRAAWLDRVRLLAAAPPALVVSTSRWTAVLRPRPQRPEEARAPLSFGLAEDASDTLASELDRRSADGASLDVNLEWIYAIVLKSGEDREARRKKAVFANRALRVLCGADLATLEPDDWADLTQRVANDAEERYATDLGRHVEEVDADEVVEVGLIVPALEELIQDLGTSGVINAADLVELRRVGLRRFADLLSTRLSGARDLASGCFDRIQAGILALREQLLGREAASRLANSPVLGSVSDLFEADTRPGRVEAFFEQLEAAVEDATSTATASASRAATARGIPTTLLRAPVTLISANAKAASTRSARAVTRSTQSALRTEPVHKIVSASQLSKAEAVRWQAHLARDGALVALTRVPISLDGLVFPIYRDVAYDADQDGEGDWVSARLVDGGEWELIPADSATETQRISTRGLQALLKGRLIRNGSAAAVFSEAVEILETATAMSRVLEGRLDELTETLAGVRDLRDLLQEELKRLLDRSQAVDLELAEARHDLGVSRALLAEEERRVAAINAWRERVLRDSVPFLIYHRGRTVDLTDPLPARDLLPGGLVDPVAAALASPHEAPVALRQLVELWRDAPARWFPAVEALLDRFDHLDQVHALLLSARERAAKAAADLSKLSAPPASGGGLLGAILRALYASAHDLAETRARSASAWSSALSVIEARAVARRNLGVGDLSEDRSIPANISKKANDFLNDLLKVSAALLDALGGVEPRLRLPWATALSEHDDAVDLRDLSQLPGFGEVGERDARDRQDPLLRYELQGLVDWIFAAVDPAEPEAVSLASTLVRVILLLASHAPVDRLITADVDAPRSAAPGKRLEVAVDHTLVRTDMVAIIHRDGAVVAKARVADVAAGRALLEVTEGEAGISVGPGDRVQIMNASQADRPLSASAAGRGPAMTKPRSGGGR